MSSFQPPQICPQYLVCLRPAQKVKVSTQSNWNSVMIWMGKYFSFSGFYTFLNRKILWRLNCWGISWQADCWCNVSLRCSRYDFFYELWLWTWLESWKNYESIRSENRIERFSILGSYCFTLIASTNTNKCVYYLIMIKFI